MSSTASDLQSNLFLNVSQHATRKIAVKTFAHLHNLSLSYHLNRKTGSILRTIDRGTSKNKKIFSFPFHCFAQKKKDAVSSLLSLLLFNIFPTFIELGMVCIYLQSAYGGWFSTIVFFSIVLYVTVTLVITEWRKKFRRQMNDADNRTSDIAVDSLTNFETVKYFTAEEHEVGKYDNAMSAYFLLEIKSKLSAFLLNASQAIIIALSMALCMILAAYGIKNGKLKLGDLVAIQLYVTQLYQPLSWLGMAYTSIIQNFINMEQVFAILEENSTVYDEVGAEELNLKSASIQFQNVSFSYKEEEPILKNVTFTVPSELS